MPCKDGREGSSTITVDNPYHVRKIKELEKSKDLLEASLCALLTELEVRGMMDLVTEAGQNGLINIHSWWDKHKALDKKRLKMKLDKFSDHEKLMLRDILNNDQ